MLHVSNLDVRYGEVQAVTSVDIEINLGEIVSITGANGAGKSSVLNAISGIHRPSGGDILFEGENIAGLKAHAVVRKGIVQVPEGRQLFATLSVRENLLAGCHTNSGFVLNRNIPEQ
ncbi:MAG TPA: ATP-binding cassette domain-containing protein, partial [Gammaproteobacteria bacterium]|nr:ATP-binding cassette domain-containing protein [Gammaproteobacteria bacterium]